jgi:putative intracellular protease/amidase
MQVRQVIAAALFVVTAVSASGAMAQEIDRAETLQAKSLASQQVSAAQRTRESVRAETRNLQAAGQLQAVGERADAIAVPAAPEATYAQRTRADVKAELAQWRSTHKLVVGERG